jgi:serine/threonine protein kinase/tetratricopeptide (TPR) repeat protein
VAPEQWPEIKEVLAAALELQPPERKAFLDDACAGKPRLRQEVESLIASYEDAGDFIERPALAGGDARDAIGRRIGPYRLEELIGRGGMGSVYRAVRVDAEFRQQVAIKLVKPGMDTGFVLRRFRNERQILATLDHPNIARLLDGGTTEDGLPYFVMEYIEGQPIDEWADQRRLSTSERLQLFRTVCDAVDYAHEKLVIHRDIKPANILITAAGVPKLLDFGIAKILDPDLATSGLDPTATILRLMTPEYASPEQVRGETITSASDVYSLGVLLYELLTGHRPYRLRSRSAYEIVQVICEEEPHRPSTAVTKSTEVTRPTGTVTLTPEMVSGTREGEPARLRKRLAGDLDNIVLKAIRKEPHRRYASAAQLSADIGRHLEGMPVEARGDTLQYKAAKFVARNRKPVMAAAVTALVALAAMAWFESRQPGAQETAAVVAPARRAVAVLGFRNLSGDQTWNWLSPALSEMLVTELAAGEKVRAVSGEASADVRSVLAEYGGKSLTGEALARVRNAVGSDYVVLGSYLAIGQKGKAAIRLDLRLQDVSSSETVASVTDSAAEADLLKLVARAGAQLRERLGMAVARPDGSLPANPEAARYYSEGIARLRAFDTPAARDLLLKAVEADPRHALSHSALALAWTSLGYDARATEHAKRAFELSAGLPREERLFLEGRYYETARAWQKASDAYRRLWTAFPDVVDYGLRLAATLTPAGHGHEALQLVDRLHKLPQAGPYDARIDLTEAEAALAVSEFQRARDAAARVTAQPSATGTLRARARMAEARAFSELGEFRKSVDAAGEARALYEKEKHSRGVAQALNVIAAGLANLGDVSGASRHYESALAIAREIGSEGGVAQSLDNLGALLRQQAEFDRARALHREALGIRRRIGDRGGEAVSLVNLSQLLHDEGKLSQARQFGEQALAIRHDLKQRRGVARGMSHLAAILRKLGERDTAETMSREAARILDEVGDGSSAAVARIHLAQALEDRGDRAGARQLYQAAIQSKRQTGDRSTLATALHGLGRLEFAEKNLPAARRLLEEAFALRHNLGEHSRASLTRLAIAELAIAEERAAAGELLARQALDEFRRERVAEKEAWAHAVLARTLAAQGKTAEARRSAAAGTSLLDRIEQREIREAVQSAARAQ